MEKRWSGEAGNGWNGTSWGMVDSGMDRVGKSKGRDGGRIGSGKSWGKWVQDSG
jgi:hypothetical protein